jgi:circadian clock protein KaiB
MAKNILKKANGNVKLQGRKGEKYILRLFITGILPNSARAIENINAICELYLKNRYELEIIDIYQQPSFALSEKIIAIPVLIKKFPLPEARLIGDLSDIGVVLHGLHLIN